MTLLKKIIILIPSILMNSIFLEMCKSKYAHFFVMKMLKYGKKEQKLIIVKEMEGKIAKVRIFYFGLKKSLTERIYRGVCI